jgi:predicted regulator of Ras-like GTPase activity (Roadblock/LC7/MglB family)
MTDPYAAAVSGTAGRSLQLDQILGTLLRQAPDVEAAAVVSFDGLPMASALPADMDEDRVAAMSAALLSLGERAAQGLGRGDLSQVYVEGDNGTVFLVSADDEAVLVAVGRVGAKVGLMLFEVRQAADAVGSALRVEAAPFEPLVAVEPVAEPVVDPALEPVVQAVAAPVLEQVVQPVAEVENRQLVPTVMPDPPVSAEPQRQAVAVPVPREVRETRWDHPSANGSTPEPDERRPATVAPDGSSWS